ncbi:MAG: Si-specific NAD(P)(+) transhydrogenase [Novosphingobium sp.]|nr:Si-specific NAD(P)(+) transhydrogenase [Novosphingobium sp.]MCP5402171.1 Si-specific NAD(P)(+) transhydrogenase [Novosphingobium sp.]
MASFDFVVLGSGPAGRRAAVQAAKLGKSVLVVDNRTQVGGVSVHTGTIPSKTLRETALNLSGWRERGFYGQSYRVKNDICAADLSARLGKTLEHEISVLEHQFARNGVKTMIGWGRFLDSHRITVSCSTGDREAEEVVEAEKVLISVGTHPYRPKGIPFNGHNVLDSDDFIVTPNVPRSLTVIGAGVIGLEYATIFSALDVPVTLIEPRDSFLDFMDREIVEHLTYLMRERGMALKLGGEVSKVRFAADGSPVCVLKDGRQVGSEVLLFTAGRMGATGKLNLDACGLTPDSRGRLAVDPVTFQTEVPHIYAAGDVIGFPSLASTSMEQGRTAACHAFGEQGPAPDQCFPLGIYAVPELSSVGLTEEEVRAKGIAYDCGIARFKETSRGHIMGISSGMLKMIVEIGTRRVLGVHIIGEGATELIHIGQAVINLGGTVDYFIDNSFNFPTLAEAYKVAALDAWNRLRKLGEPAAALEAVPEAKRDAA